MTWGNDTYHAPRSAPGPMRGLPEPAQDDPWFRHGGVRASCDLPWAQQADRCPLPWASHEVTA